MDSEDGGVLLEGWSTGHVTSRNVGQQGAMNRCWAGKAPCGVPAGQTTQREDTIDGGNEIEWIGLSGTSPAAGWW